ncbi:UDP-N-acetylmuramate--alanine ligase [Desulfitispora alkaliphila]|uniref:UDP-N-acetylmuramate--L-alanine ligase n=1 Tax=Desulfitispora alkaliphila TaxID=622674 RepID=UPI003D2514F3
MRYHFIGVAGSGMSAIAQYISQKGHIVSGSDRVFEKGENKKLFNKLVSKGISIHKQTGELISTLPVEGTKIIVSSAIEEDNVELVTAKKMGFKIVKRAELLAEIFNKKWGIAVAGTSGKTSVSGMVTSVLKRAGKSPTAILGGELINITKEGESSNLIIGKSEYMCIEADESDGSLVLYQPKLGIITNISRDHKSLEELEVIFKEFAERCNSIIINGDCENTMEMIRKNKIDEAKVITFGIEKECNVQAKGILHHDQGTEFSVLGSNYNINQIGKYNVYNALVAIAVGRHLGISDSVIAEGLNDFKGMKRRLELKGEIGGISVYDDYAHNPAKVAAAIQALKERHSRIHLIYQFHGFGPTIFTGRELVETFITQLNKDDKLYILPIFAPIKTKKTASIDPLVKELKERGVKVHSYNSRTDIVNKVINCAKKEEDAVVVMGARDNTLTELAEDIILDLKESVK